MSRKMSRSARNQAFVIALVFFCAFAGTGAIQPYVVPILKLESKTGSERLASLVMALVYLSFAFARQFVPFVVRRLGIRRSINLGVAGYAFFTVNLYFCDSFAGLLAGAIVWGIAASVFWGSSSMRMLELSQKSAYGKAAGNLYFGTQAGLVLGVIVQGFLCGKSPSSIADYRGAICWAIAASSLGVGVSFLIRPSENEYVESEPAQFKKWFSDRRMMTVVFCLFMSSPAYGICLRQLNTQIAAISGAGSIGLTLAPFYIAQVTASRFAGSLSDRFGRARVWSVGFLLGSGGMFLSRYVGSTAAYALGAALLGLMFGTIPTVCLAWVGDETTPRNRLPLHGFLFAWRDFGVALPMLFGVKLADPSVLMIFGVGAAACAVLVRLMPERLTVNAEMK